MDKRSKKKGQPPPTNSPEPAEQKTVLVVLGEKKRRGKPLQRAGFVDHKGDHMKALSLRLPQQLVTDVDWELKQNAGRVSRNTFFIEAIRRDVQDRQRQRERIGKRRVRET